MPDQMLRDVPARMFKLYKFRSTRRPAPLEGFAAKLAELKERSPADGLHIELVINELLRIHRGQQGGAR